MNATSLNTLHKSDTDERLEQILFESINVPNRVEGIVQKKQKPKVKPYVIPLTKK